MVGEGVNRAQDAPANIAPGFTSVDDIAVAAHELKAPLAVIRQLALELGDSSLTDSERRIISRQIELVAERGLRFTSNITRAEQLALLETDPINPLQVCDEVIRELKPLYAAQGRTIRLHVSRRAQLVVANHDLLRRILLNFGDNALHYGDEQGAVELFAQLQHEHQKMRLGVRDYGPMVPADVWRRLAAGEGLSVQQRPNSSGLGLKIVGQFAQAIGGRIGAIRHRDGASFYIELPISNQLTLL